MFAHFKRHYKLYTALAVAALIGIGLLIAAVVFPPIGVFVGGMLALAGSKVAATLSVGALAAITGALGAGLSLFTSAIFNIKHAVASFFDRKWQLQSNNSPQSGDNLSYQGEIENKNHGNRTQNVFIPLFNSKDCDRKNSLNSPIEKTDSIKTSGRDGENHGHEIQTLRECQLLDDSNEDLSNEDLSNVNEEDKNDTMMEENKNNTESSINYSNN